MTVTPQRSLTGADIISIQYNRPHPELSGVARDAQRVCRNAPQVIMRHRPALLPSLGRCQHFNRFVISTERRIKIMGLLVDSKAVRRIYKGERHVHSLLQLRTDWETAQTAW